MAWPSERLPGMDFRCIDDESVHGKLCHRVEGAWPDGSLKLSYWWSPRSGVLEQIAFEGNYSDGGGPVHEMARMELESRTRGEALESWLASADTRQGALQAILLNPSLPITVAQLVPSLAQRSWFRRSSSDDLASDDPASQAMAVAITSSRKLEAAIRHS